MLKYALVGFGGLGKLHFKNLLEIEKERDDIILTAICGADRATLNHAASINIGSTSLEGVDFSKYHFYDTIEELFENEKLDFVITALPTKIHASSAVYALNKGVHVFSEKPMALSFADCEKMVKTAKDNNKVLMIGQCLRFNGTCTKVKEYIDSGIYGKVLRAEFKRYSQLPIWSINNWLLDRKQSGGCPIDLHVHDVDLINYYFGLPKSVSSHTTSNKVELESIFTTYEYDDIFVMSSADWSFPQKYPFNDSMTILFEKAAVVTQGSDITVYTDDEIIKPEVDEENHFMKELKEFIECAISGKESEISNCESVMKSMKIAEAEINSAEKNGEKVTI